MAVTVSPPLGTPENLVDTLEAGGSLDASTTYYWRIVASNVDDLTRTDTLESKASVEGTFTTDAVNKKVKLDWDAVAGASYYWVYVTKTSGTYTASTACIQPRGYYRASCTTNTYTWDGTAGTNRPFHPFAYTGTLPLSFGNNMGRLSVSFTGDIGLGDIYDQIVSDGYGEYCYYDGSIFAGFLNIHNTGSTAGSLVIENKIVILLRGGIENTNANATISIGLDNSVGTGQSCCLYICNYRQKCFTTSSVGISVSRTTIGSSRTISIAGTNYIYNNQIHVDIGSTTNKECYMEDFLRANVGGSTDGLRFYSGELNISSSGQTHTNSNFNSGIWRCDAAGPTIIDTHSNYGGAWDIGDVHNTSGITLVDCTFPSRSQNIPIIYIDNANREKVTIKNRLDITVQDLNQVAISGATVTITDANGDAIAESPLTTNASGEIDTVQLTRMTIEYGTDNSPSAGSGYNNYLVYYTPHTVTISKTGYATRVLKYTMDQKRDEVEKLTPDSTNIQDTTLYDSTIY